MVNACCVHNCHNQRRRESDRGYYRLPAVINRQGEKTKNLSIVRRKEWLRRLKLTGTIKRNPALLRVCSDHFVTGKPSVLYDTTNPDWAPSLNLGHNSSINADSAVVRFDRDMAQVLKKTASAPAAGTATVLVQLGTGEEECHQTEATCGPNEKESQTGFIRGAMIAMPCEIIRLSSEGSVMTDTSLMCVFKSKVDVQPEPPQVKKEEELCSNQEEEHPVLKREITSERDGTFVTQCEDLSENNICKERTKAEQPLCKQETSSSLDEKEEPELPQIKEEWEEVCIIGEGEHIDGQQKNDCFIGTEHDQESLGSKSEQSVSPDLGEHAQIPDGDNMADQPGPPSDEIAGSDYVTVQVDPPSDESSHFCEICGKFYIRSHNLKNHMKTHKGLKTGFRKICPKPSMMYLVWPTK